MEQLRDRLAALIREEEELVVAIDAEAIDDEGLATKLLAEINRTHRIVAIEDVEASIVGLAALHDALPAGRPKEDFRDLIDRLRALIG